MIRRAALALFPCLVLAVSAARGESLYEPDFSPMRKEAARLHEEGNKPWKANNRREKVNAKPAGENSKQEKTIAGPEKAGDRPAGPKSTIDASPAQSAGQEDAVTQHNERLMNPQAAPVPRDNADNVLLLTKAAEQGDAHAQCVLGAMYANGQGVPRDEAKAARLYERAAEKNNAEAQYALGWMYAHGRGVPRDEVKAVRWCLKAAEQGMLARSSCQKLRRTANRSVK